MATEIQFKTKQDFINTVGSKFFTIAYKNKANILKNINSQLLKDGTDTLPDTSILVDNLPYHKKLGKVAPNHIKLDGILSMKFQGTTFCSPDFLVDIINKI